jgi:hypothetical protein
MLSKGHQTLQEITGAFLKTVAKALLPIADIFLAPFVYPAAILLWLVRSAGVHRMRCSKKALTRVGVFPITNHYFDPLFDSRHLRRPLHKERHLPNIKWNVQGQLRLLRSFCYSGEIASIPSCSSDPFPFDFDNVAFASGDAEFLYSMIRLMKPARLFEIGSGHSTRIAINAIEQNRKERPGYGCKHLCIEPYEQPWLEQAEVEVVRRRVEELDLSFFSELEENDILFIDSSHVIRPQGDVLFEYLELLSTLNTGVIVHIHDIFSPRDYPEAWVKDEVRLWNEQYLLEAFLTGNRDWEVIGAVNYLHHNHFEALSAACPYLTSECEPGSFYIRKIA